MVSEPPNPSTATQVCEQPGTPKGVGRHLADDQQAPLGALDNPTVQPEVQREEVGVRCRGTCGQAGEVRGKVRPTRQRDSMTTWATWAPGVPRSPHTLEYSAETRRPGQQRKDHRMRATASALGVSQGAPSRTVLRGPFPSRVPSGAAETLRARQPPP